MPERAALALGVMVEAGRTSADPWGDHAEHLVDSNSARTDDCSPRQAAGVEAAHARRHRERIRVGLAGFEPTTP